jgi:hypothetical protein
MTKRSYLIGGLRKSPKSGRPDSPPEKIDSADCSLIDLNFAGQTPQNFEIAYVAAMRSIGECSKWKRQIRKNQKKSTGWIGGRKPCRRRVRMSPPQRNTPSVS